jgi:hypothetical protein
MVVHRNEAGVPVFFLSDSKLFSHDYFRDASNTFHQPDPKTPLLFDSNL